jgi:hypothetical protein
VSRPVEPGSDLLVDFEIVESDLKFPDSKVVAICGTGFGERAGGAKKFANIVAGILHCTAYGVVPPYAEITKKATNPRRALRDMTDYSFLEVSRELADGHTVVYMGNSLAGPPAYRAAAHSGSMVGTVSSAGFHNRLLGKTEPQRAKNLVHELLVTTTAQHIKVGDWAVLHVFAGGFEDGKTMKLRSLVGAGFVVSDELEDMTVEAAVEVGGKDVLSSPDKDACFWQDGYTQVLGASAAGTVIRLVSGPHACIQGKFFEPQLVPVAEHIAAQLGISANR